MPNDRSIPRSMDNTVVRKWLSGMSAQEIVDWFEHSNRRRLVRVHTSRSSVERLLEEHASWDNGLVPLRSVLDCRRGAARNLARLQEIVAEYRKRSSEAPPADESPEARAERRESQRSLAQEERSLHRMLRMAGVTGRIAEDFLWRRKRELRQVEQDGIDEAHVESFLDDLMDKATGGRTSEELAALVPPVLQHPPPAGKESVRFESESNGKQGGSATSSVALDPQTAMSIPLIEDPLWELTPEQESEWTRIKSVMHALLLCAWTHNGKRAPSLAKLRNPVPGEPESRAGKIVADAIPLFEVPAWPMPAAAKTFLEEQKMSVDVWLHWFRDATLRAAAGHDNWRDFKRLTLDDQGHSEVELGRRGSDLSFDL